MTALATMVQPLLDLIGHNVVWALATVFVVSAAEALFIVGLFIPSTVVLVGVGTLVGIGQLPFLPVFVAATAGAIVGDAMSYWFGHTYRDRIRETNFFRRYHKVIARSEAFFQRFGPASIFLGRFVPGVKALVPAVAGIAGMGVAEFTAINVTSAVAWAGLHIVPPVLVAMGVSLGSSWAWAAVMLALAVGAGFLVMHRGWRGA
ncbi:MAG: DedA family protein [Rhodobiaceae bacterium]|nr:DedA family protein [Rhodobiaceae bacterium]